MSITTTLGQLAAAEEAFARLAELKLAIRPAYHLKKLVAVVRAELKHFEELRVELIKQLGEKRAPTDAEAVRHGREDIWEVKPEHLPEFQKQVQELAGQEVVLGWGPFELAWLDDSHEISAADLDRLGPLVCWSEEDGKAAQ